MNDVPSTPQPIAEEDLHAYVDNLLDAARRREVQDFLDRHPDAAGQVAGFAAQRQDLRSALARIADEPVPPRLNLRRMISEHRARQHWDWRIAAAVFLAVGVGGIGGWSLRGVAGEEGSSGVMALAREATRNYAVYATDRVRPVEMGPGQKAELVNWVSSRLQRPVAVPDLSKSGYQFIGGRLVTTEHGPAGMFVYDDGKGVRLAVLVRPMATERESRMMERSEGSIAGFTWAKHGLGYSVVGAERPETLHPLADEVRRQIGAV
jgi:anti-sigma factor RsiW